LWRVNCLSQNSCILIPEPYDLKTCSHFYERSVKKNKKMIS
jgi:hypothetical protein